MVFIMIVEVSVFLAKRAWGWPMLVDYIGETLKSECDGTFKVAEAEDRL